MSAEKSTPEEWKDNVDEDMARHKDIDMTNAPDRLPMSMAQLNRALTKAMPPDDIEEILERSRVIAPYLNKIDCVLGEEYENYMRSTETLDVTLPPDFLPRDYKPKIVPDIDYDGLCDLFKIF